MNLAFKMAWGSSMSHGNLSKRFNLESKPFFLLDILLFFQARVIVLEGSMFRG